MLGKTAGGLFWMFRYLERSQNTARLVEAGHHMALTRSDSAEDEWSSILTTAGVRDAYLATYDVFETETVIDFLLRDRANPSSVISIISSARDNARLVRTALTREVWEAINECWMILKDALSMPIRDRDLPEILATIRRQSALVRGTTQETMLRNDIFDFARIGTFLERADNTARIIDVKYYLLLPSASFVGSSLDNVQWETILRSVSAERSYHWLTGGDITPIGIAEFLLLDRQMPRSLAFCYSKISDNLTYLENDYETRLPCHDLADQIGARLKNQSIESIFETGLHESLADFIAGNKALGLQIEKDYRFYE